MGGWITTLTGSQGRKDAFRALEVRGAGSGMGWERIQPGVIEPAHRLEWLDKQQYHSRQEEEEEKKPYFTQTWVWTVSERGPPSRDITAPLDQPCLEPPSWGWRQILGVWGICGCEDFPAEWNYAGETDKERTSLRTECWGITNMKVWEEAQGLDKKSQREPGRPCQKTMREQCSGSPWKKGT